MANNESSPKSGGVPHGEHVCSSRIVFRLLDSGLRRWVTQTRRLARTYLREGMTVLDVGCGRAPMLLDIASVVGSSGRIICADIQANVLEQVRAKARRAGIEDRVTIHLSAPDTLGVEAESVDFVFAFWMLHETPDPLVYLRQITECLKPSGQFLLIEPKGHVSAETIERIIEQAIQNGLDVEDFPSIRMSRAVRFRKHEQHPA